MGYSGQERRKFARITGRFIVSYRVLEEDDCIDISQTKNISMGGMLLTTNRQFPPGSKLAIEIRLPFDLNPILLIGRVVDSHEITKDLIYDTRLEFLTMDDRHRKIITQTVDYYVKKEAK
jgi:c-di-GMP-binding flagellar brake protein YcgR